MSNEIDTNDHQTQKGSQPVSSESNESDYIEEATVRKLQNVASDLPF